MSDPTWETIEVPKGAFIGWGTAPGQHVTGKIVDYDPSGGRDFNDQPCPQLAIDLSEPAASFNKAGERRDYPPGELVNLTVGQSGLKAAVKRADPSPGDLIKIMLTGTERTTKGNTVKTFDVKIARGSHPAPAQPQQGFSQDPAQPQQGFAPAQSGTPPF